MPDELPAELREELEKDLEEAAERALSEEGEPESDGPVISTAEGYASKEDIGYLFESWTPEKSVDEQDDDPQGRDTGNGIHESSGDRQRSLKQRLGQHIAEEARKSGRGRKAELVGFKVRSFDLLSEGGQFQYAEFVRECHAGDWIMTESNIEYNHSPHPTVSGELRSVGFVIVKASKYSFKKDEPEIDIVQKPGVSYSNPTVAPKESDEQQDPTQPPH